jgi:serine/threonine-protein kinase
MLPLTPTRLGRYEILDEIGKGAMGVVYLAKDPLIGRLVALKTFRSAFSIRDQEMEQFRARFIREAQSAGILSHPNIVTVHDVVEDAGEGLAFIAMEYVRGTNLKMALQGDRPLAFARVADIVSQIAEALDYAHSQRVIHRDVKPANVILTEDGRVKITDFGIARLDTSNLTQEGQLLGTPNYMAPEQVQGKEVDHRADIFALGVVLYEMLTRHKPFQGENLTVVSHRIVYDQFTPLRDYAKDVPPGVEKIISKALEKDPNRRYQRARELAEDVKKVVTEVAGDDLNETQSLSETMVIPAAAAPVLAKPAAGAPAAPKPPLWSGWSRLRGRLGGGAEKPAPVPPPPAGASAGDTTSGSGSGTGSTLSRSSIALVPPMETPELPPLPAAATLPPPLPVPQPSSPPELGNAVPAAASSEETAGTEGSLSAVPLPPALPAPSPPRPPQTSAGRLALFGGLIALLVVAGIVLLWRSNHRQPVAPPPQPRAAATPQAALEQVVSLLEEGRNRMRRGEFQQAAAVYRQAEGLYPNPGITRLREEAERRDVAFQELVGQETDLAHRRAEAAKALAERRYADAMSAAQAVLAARPGDEKAKDLFAKAQSGARREKLKNEMAARGPERPTEPTPATDLTPSPSPVTEAPAAPQKLYLHIFFYVEPSAEGTVRLFQNDTLLWETPFKRKKTFLNRDEKNRTYTGTAEIAPGSSSLKVTVSLGGRSPKTVSKTLPVSALAASSHRLEIRLLEGRDDVMLSMN